MSSAASRENRKVHRIRLEKPLKVVLASMGAQVRYEARTSDISHNGFFLDFENPGRFPFNGSSILEVWTELEPNVAVFFNGKMTRVVGKNNTVMADGGSGIAIKIVQIDRDNEKILFDFINSRIPGKANQDEVA